MANWLLDYIEMTEYIPSELREQLTSIRELDLQVHNAMDELERDIKQFFSKIDTLSPQERQDQYDAFLKKCDVATRAASDKVKVADKLHDLVEKSMRLLDQGLEKLKEDLLEGDKAYIVEDLERRSQELDEQIRLEHEDMLQRQSKLQELKTHSKNHKSIVNNNNDGLSNHVNSQIATINHRHSLPAQTSQNCHHPQQNNNSNHHHHQQANHRNRHHSTSTVPSVGRQKKHERKRQNSTMTTFNRNSCLDDDSSSQSFLQSPLTTPDYLAAMQSSNKTLNDVGGAISNNSLTTMKGMMAGNKNLTGIFDKINGNDPLAGAKQPILTAIDAAHAVSPNATNSDKLVLFSSNPNGDKSNQNQLNSTHNNNLSQQQQQQTLSGSQNPYQLNHQLSNHLLSTVGYTSGDSTLNSSNTNNSLVINAKNERHNHDPHLHPNQPNQQHHQHHHSHQLSGQPGGTPFSVLPRHDPIMMAASQAINATQNMVPGRRTSSLKASYAAVNSGRLQTSAPNHHHHNQQQQQQLFEQGGGLIPEVYCKCRSHIQGSNMIACDNSKCKIEWFHYECVGITTPPEGEWYCDECRITLNIQKNHKQPKLEGVNVT